MTLVSHLHSSHKPLAHVTSCFRETFGADSDQHDPQSASLWLFSTWRPELCTAQQRHHHHILWRIQASIWTAVLSPRECTKPRFPILTKTDVIPNSMSSHVHLYSRHDHGHLQSDRTPTASECVAQRGGRTRASRVVNDHSPQRNPKNIWMATSLHYR